MSSTYSTEGFICPHCGHLYSEPEGLHWSDNEDPEAECEMCEETFFVRTHTKISWQTFKDNDDF